MLSNTAQGFQLVFTFSPDNDPEVQAVPEDASAEFPEYLIVTPGIYPVLGKDGVRDVAAP